MTKNILIFILLVPYPASSQIGSGSIVIVNRTKDEVIVAADSRGTNDNGTPPSNSYCKISAFGHQFIFATVGHANYDGAPFDQIGSWDNAELARDAVRNVSSSKDTQSYLNDLAAYWARSVGQRWDPFCKRDLARCKKLVESSNGMLTVGIFIGPQTLLSGAVITLNSNGVFSSIQYGIGREMSQCSLCGQLQGARICGAGAHLDTVVDFCSKRKHGDRIAIRTPLKDASPSTKLAVKIVETIIDTYDKTVGDVGGDVDSVTITKSGAITWNSRKCNCPESQD